MIDCAAWAAGMPLVLPATRACTNMSVAGGEPITEGADRRYRETRADQAALTPSRVAAFSLGFSRTPSRDREQTLS